MSRKSKSSIVYAIFFMAVVLVVSQVPGKSYGFGITIDVAPNTLNIQSQSQVVTVHTNIAYWSVDHDNVYLNDILISSWKADNQGNFVAKFLMSEVKALADSGDLAVPGENELTLDGSTTEGTEFTGSATITVINVQPEGAGKKK